METYYRAYTRRFEGIVKSSLRLKSGATNYHTVSTRQQDERVLDGIKNPYWRQQVASGRSATTPLTAWRDNVGEWRLSCDVIAIYTLPHNDPGSLLAGLSASGTVYWGRMYSFNDSMVSGLPETVADNIAKSAFVRKARSAQTTWQSGVFLGELSKTIRMIRSPLKSLRSQVVSYANAVHRAAKRPKNYNSLSPSSKKKWAEKSTKAVADTWLEYSFGIIPLTLDIDDALRVIDERYLKDDWKAIRGSGVWRNIVGSGARVFNSAAYCPNITWQYENFQNVIVKYYGSVDQGAYAVTNMRRIGLDLSNFVPTVWELVPWSFLIDYFTNVGDIVSAASFRRTGVRWSSRTVVKEMGTRYHNPVTTPEPSANGYTKFTIGGAINSSFTNSRIKVVRSHYSGSFVPDVQFQLPTLPKQLLNLTALAASFKFR